MDTCFSCMGTGRVLRMLGLDEDHYPKYCEIPCPACHGVGKLDMGELFVVPRGMIKDEFFVTELFTEIEQEKLRTLLEEERKFFEKLS